MGKHKLSSKMLGRSFIHSDANWCLESYNTSQYRRWCHNLQTFKAIIVITITLIVCCNCFDESNYPERRYKHSTIKKKEIHLAGIFPINGDKGWQGGQVCEPAAKIALDDVNAREDLLPGYNLHLHWNDSGCDAGRGAAVMYDLLYNTPQKVLLLAGCSTVCTTVAEAARMWNLVTVCYGASSPALSNRARFPTLFRTHPSATVHNPTRVRLFEKFRWSRIAVLQESEEVFSTTLDDLETRTKEEGITIAARESFLLDPQAAIGNLKRQDARIIVGLFYVKAARKVLCEIYKQGLYGPKYVWFFIGWYEDNWFTRSSKLKEENINCTVEQMQEAAEGHFTTEALQWNQDKSPTISGKTVDDFDRRLKRLLSPNYDGVKRGIMPEGYLEAPLAYDAIWAVALALNNTMMKLSKTGETLEDYNYQNERIADIILNEIADLQFKGMSGSVAFSEETGDRMSWTKIEQLQKGKYEIVGYYDQTTDNLTWVKPPEKPAEPSLGASLNISITKSITPSSPEEAQDINGIPTLMTTTTTTTTTSLVLLDDNEPNRIQWLGKKIPQDRTIVENQLRELNVWLYFSMVTLALIGVLFAGFLIYFNFKYSHRRIIQHSHPSCNNLMLSGIMLCLLAIIPLGLDGNFVSPSTFPVACGFGTWMLTLGFTLAYGAMFSKIWRVRRLSTKNKSDIKKAHVVPWKLWFAVGGLLLADIILLTVWTVVDPLKRDVHDFEIDKEQDSEQDIVFQPQLEHCKSSHHSIWMGIMYAYKGLQLILGLFLAYETRSVKLKQINDSRLVGMAIYNVVVLCMITAPVMLVIGNQQNAAFCFVSLANLFCCFLSMALIMAPKIIFIRKHAHDPREKEDDEKDTAELELKYREILRENENFQKKISEIEQKLVVLRKRIADKKEDAIDEATSLCKTGGNAIQEIEANIVPLPTEKTIPIIHPDTTKSYASSARVAISTKPISDFGQPSAVIHQPNIKSCETTKTYNANGTAAPLSIKEEYVQNQGSNPDCLNHTSSDTTSGPQISTSVQYYNVVAPSDGLRQRNAASKNDKTRKSERSVSIQHNTEAPPLIDSDRSAVSDLERTTSLKGITVFRGHVPGDITSTCQPFVSCNEHGNSKSISSTSKPNTRTSTSATSCATAVTDGHIVHYGDEHVESYL